MTNNIVEKTLSSVSPKSALVPKAPGSYQLPLPVHLASLLLSPLYCPCLLTDKPPVPAQPSASFLLHLLNSTMLGLVLELVLALLSCGYYILEATVKLFLPSKMFHKDISGQVKADYHISCSIQISKNWPRHRHPHHDDAQVLLLTGGGSGIGRLMCLRSAARPGNTGWKGRLYVLGWLAIESVRKCINS